MQMKMSPPPATEATSETTLSTTPCYIGHPSAMTMPLPVVLFANIKPKNRKPKFNQPRCDTAAHIAETDDSHRLVSVRFHRSSLHLFSIIVRQMFS
jgi:hypothetical protein